MRPTVACTAVLAALLGGTVLAGRGALAALVLLVCALLLVDIQGLLRRAGAPAILPASAVAGIGLPLAVVTGTESAVIAIIAGSFLLAALIGLGGRRRRFVRALGATLLAGLLPGLGGSAVILLFDIDPAILLALAAALLAGEAAAAGAHRWRGQGLETVAPAALAGTAVAAAVSAAVLPLEMAAGLGALALLGVLGGGTLRGALLHDERPAPGLLLAATASLALSAPPALAIAARVPILG